MLCSPAQPKTGGEYRERAQLPCSEPSGRSRGPGDGRGLRGRSLGSPASISAPLLPARPVAARRPERPPTSLGPECCPRSFARPAASARRPAGTRQVDCGGRTLLPAPAPLPDPPSSPGAPLLPGQSSQSAPPSYLPREVPVRKQPGL